MREQFGRLYNTVHAEEHAGCPLASAHGVRAPRAHAHPDTGEMFHYFEMN